MNFKILIFTIFAIMLMIAPVVATNAIWWTDDKGNAITSAEPGDTVYYQFNTVPGSGGHSHTPPPYDYWGIVMYRQDSQSGTYIYDAVRYPAYSARILNNTTGGYINFSAHSSTYLTLPLAFQNSPPAEGDPITPSPWSSYFWLPASNGYVGGSGQQCWWPANPSEPFGNTYKNWTGYGTFVIPSDIPIEFSAYKVSLISYSFPNRWDDALCDNWTTYTAEQGNATLTVSEHWDIFTGFGDLMRDWGGDGLRYIVGAIIVIVMAMLPFFLLRRLNVYITLIMIVCGVGIAYLTGLFDLPVVFALALGSLAIFFLVSKASKGDQ